MSTTYMAIDFAPGYNDFVGNRSYGDTRSVTAVDWSLKNQHVRIVNVYVNLPMRLQLRRLL